MTSNETSAADERSTGSGSRYGRRRFVQLSGAAVAVGLAGCSDLGIGTGDEEDGTPEDGSGDAVNGTESATETNESTATDEPTDTEAEGAEAEETETESEGDVHEHGNLYLEIDGERQSFDDEKYYQASEYEDGQAEGVFHFHPDGNEYYWHMHDERLTLQEALASLPDIAYESSGGSHVVEYEGETYEDGADATEIEISQRDTAIDPTQYELQDGDIVWIEIDTGSAGV